MTKIEIPEIVVTESADGERVLVDGQHRHMAQNHTGSGDSHPMQNQDES